MRLKLKDALSDAGRRGERAKKKSGGKRIKKMLCVDFENLLTDYIEGVVGPETNRLMGEHAMKCPCAMRLFGGTERGRCLSNVDRACAFERT